MKEVKKWLVLILDISEALRFSTVKTESEKYIFLEIKVQTKYERCRLYTLLNSDIQENFISQAIMLEEDIIYKKIITCVNEVENYSIAVYKYEFIKMYVTDMWGIA